MVDDPHSPLHERLRAHAHHLRDTPASLQALAEAHGPALQGSLLVLLAAPCALPVPGVGTVLGVGIAALAVAMWRGQGAPCLPQRVAELELPGPWAQRVLDGLATAYAMAGRHARARLGPLAGPGWRLAHAAVVGLMALIVVMPIPFGNVLPALALTLIGLGLVFRDGLAVVLGLLGAGVALGATAGLVLLAWTWGSDWVGHWAGNWAGS